MLIFENKVETMYNDDVHSATIKHNKSPFYVNPEFNENNNNNPYFNFRKSVYKNGPIDERDKVNILRVADLKYFNYAIDQDKITSIYRDGFYKEIITIVTLMDRQKNYVLSQYELDNNKIKEL
jgi:hypothetical protein